MRRILVAGGGTGGHVFPGLAIARALGRLAEVEVVFAGSPRGLETRVVPEHGYALELLDVEPMKGGGPQRAIRGALVAAKATRQAHGIVRRLRPAAVLSVGGYAAGPAALACVSQRVPLAILEPNSTLGLANRLLAPFAKRAYIAWKETGRHFKGDKARLYGVPLRPGFEPRAYVPAPAGPRRLLVLGGSQGARGAQRGAPARRRAGGGGGAGAAPLSVVHQAGRDREASVREAYAQSGAPRRRGRPVPRRRRGAHGRCRSRHRPFRRGDGRGDRRRRSRCHLRPVPARGRRPPGEERALARRGRRRDLHPPGGRRRGAARGRDRGAARRRCPALPHGRRRARARPAARRRGHREGSARARGDRGEEPHEPAKKNGAANGSSSELRVTTTARKEVS